MPDTDMINHPPHYTAHPSGVECITITEHMGFNLGNAVKYIWRADLKTSAIEDLKKARWYLDREIAKRETVTCEHVFGKYITGQVGGSWQLVCAKCGATIKTGFGNPPP